MTAPSNVAVDNNATEVLRNLPDELRDTTNMLRLEVDGADLQAIPTQVNYTDFEGLEHTDPAKYKELNDAADTPKLKRPIQEIMVELVQFEDEA